MSAKELYSAFIKEKRVKVKVILLGFIEGVVSGVEFKKNKMGQVVCCGIVKGDNGNSYLHATAKDIFLIDNS